MLGLASEIPSASVRCIDDGSSSTIAGALSRLLHANSSTSSTATTATNTSRYEHSTGNCGLVSSSMVMTLQSLAPSGGSTDSLEDVMMCSSVAGPRTPDASEKDTDGESEDMTVEREVVGVEAMESAVQLLLLLMGESPSRLVSLNVCTTQHTSLCDEFEISVVTRFVSCFVRVTADMGMGIAQGNW